MGGWAEYAAAWLAFVLSHLLPARPALRRHIVAAMGERGFLLFYSAASILILAWMIGAAGRAPFVPLWDWAWWHVWATNLAMAAACLLLALGLGGPNPFSIGGARAEAYDPMRAGVLSVTRHPVLWAVTLWAAGHVPPNGDLAHVTLFGGFAFLGVAGMRALDARRSRAWGEARWAERQPRRLGALGPAWRWMGAVLVFASLLIAHPVVIGVCPMPPAP